MCSRLAQLDGLVIAAQQIQRIRAGFCYREVPVKGREYARQRPRGYACAKAARKYAEMRTHQHLYSLCLKKPTNGRVPLIPNASTVPKWAGSADDRYCIDKSASYGLSRVVGQGERQLLAHGRALFTD